jgi:hypothetical protein
MEPVEDIRVALIARTRRVPAVQAAAGDGGALARQLDVALMQIGFKCSHALVEHLSGLHPVAAREAADAVLRALRELVGDHVRHNAYFIDFPHRVPDTVEFWSKCVANALADPRAKGNVAEQLASGFLNLLDLPRYGRYQHTYEEMLAAHAPLVESARDRVNLIELGGPLHEESHALYLSLAGGRFPLSEGDLRLLATLAELHVHDPQPERIDVRENRALINRARLAHGLPLDVDTPLDVLRLAVALSGGDVSLTTSTPLRSLRRAERRVLLAALDAVVRANPAKLGDVRRQRERFKRLGERLHPHEYPHWDAGREVFAVARGESAACSLAGRAEIAFSAGDPDAAVAVLASAPGMLVRGVDRIARAGADPHALAGAVAGAAPRVSTRVLLSLREHLLNRDAPAVARIFVNQQARAWVTGDARAPLDVAVVAALSEVLDAEIASRLPRIERLVVDPAVRTLALPLTGKNRPEGLGILPRGSTTPVGEHVRFFVRWKQRERRTDYDLSVIMLDDAFQAVGQVSWTNLSDAGIVHSGDLTEAPAGASEFIDLDLSTVSARYVVPQVHVYDGEDFDRAEEAFFGYMQRTPEQAGRPFEPRTVRAKSDLYGRGRVTLPLVFAHGEDGWQARWTHLNLAGRARFNRVEDSHRSTSLVMRGIVERRYLGVPYLEDLLRSRGTLVETLPAWLEPPLAYLGLEYPEDLPPGSTAFTPANLTELLNPA